MRPALLRRPAIYSIREGLSGAYVTSYANMTLAQLTDLLRQRAYAVTSRVGQGLIDDELQSRISRLSDAVSYASTVRAAGRTHSGATSTEWSAFTSALDSAGNAANAAVASTTPGLEPVTPGRTPGGGSPTPRPDDDEPPAPLPSEAGAFLTNPFVLAAGAGLLTVGVLLALRYVKARKARAGGKK